jgi:hypothetical protein
MQRAASRAPVTANISAGPVSSEAKSAWKARFPGFGKGFMDRRGAMRKGPDQKSGHVNHGEGAQGPEPEEGAVAQMEAHAAAGFDPGVGGIGWTVDGADAGRFFEEGRGDDAGLRAGGAGFRMLLERVRPEAGARGAGDAELVFTVERLHANLFWGSRR